MVIASVLLVSIPERVLEALKLLKGLGFKKIEGVSIPERVLEALKLKSV